MIDVSTVGKTVPWIDWQEWLVVNNAIYKFSQESVQIACRMLKLWTIRCKAPVAVEATACLLEVMQNDSVMWSNCHQNDDRKTILACNYGMSITRTINLLTDNAQRGEFAVSVDVLARRLGIPSWIVQLRHSCCHKESFPMLSILRRAASTLLNCYLIPRYWNEQARGIRTELRCSNEPQLLSSANVESYISATCEPASQSQPCVMDADDSALHYLLRHDLVSDSDGMSDRVYHLMTKSVSRKSQCHLIQSMLLYGNSEAWKYIHSFNDQPHVALTLPKEVLVSMDYERFRGVLESPPSAPLGISQQAVPVYKSAYGGAQFSLASISPSENPSSSVYSR